MEPVTHILTGACLARTGLNRRAAYATLVMAVAAEFPDIDTIWGFLGPVEGFAHHRGITHTLVGVPFEAGLLVAGIYGLHRWRVTRSERQTTTSPRPLTVAPVRWGVLYGFTLLALLSHLLLDFTNNYGIRPFFPFNPRWYAASITFIFDPLMSALLLMALVLPPLFRLIGAEVGSRKQPFVARGWSAAALCAVVCLWSARSVEHGHAVTLAMAQSVRVPDAGTPSPATTDAPFAGREAAATVPQTEEIFLDPAPQAEPVFVSPRRVLVSPDPFSVFRWYAASDFGTFYQLATVDARGGTVTPDGSVWSKPPTTPVTRAAMASALGRAYMDWSSMPIVTDSRSAEGAEEVDGAPATLDGSRVVMFRDPRFLGDVPLMRSRVRAPLTAVVEVDPKGEVVRQAMDGKPEH